MDYALELIHLIQQNRQNPHHVHVSRNFSSTCAAFFPINYRRPQVNSSQPSQHCSPNHVHQRTREAGKPRSLEVYSLKPTAKVCTGRSSPDIFHSPQEFTLVRPHLLANPRIHTCAPQPFTLLPTATLPRLCPPEKRITLHLRNRRPRLPNLNLSSLHRHLSQPRQ